MNTCATIVIIKAIPNTTKFLIPLISPKKRMPQMDPMTPGPVVIIGNETTRSSFELATNHEISAIDHMNPLTKVAKMILGYNAGLFLE